MGPTSSIPHGKSMLDEGCSLWFKFSAARVEGVSGFLAEGSLPSPSECGGMVSEGVRSHPLECLRRTCEGHRICKRHHTDSSGVSFVIVSRIFQESCFPPQGEPRVSGLQHWQLYPGRSFHVDTVGR